jgi:hypothetical protein
VVSQEEIDYSNDDIFTTHFDSGNSSSDNNSSLDIISSLIIDDTYTTHLNDSNTSYIDSLGGILFNTSFFDDLIRFQIRADLPWTRTSEAG